jgi:hypothetical protein
LFAFGVLTVAVLAIAASAQADLLVMRDGTRVETRGPWEERGRLVVFTDPSGKLLSIRLSDVDVEASHAATKAAEEARNRPVEPPAPTEAVFRITDADVAHIDPEDEADDLEGEAVDVEEEAVAVATWEKIESTVDEGVGVRGTIENRGQDVAVAIQVTATIYDLEGLVVGTGAAQLGSTGLVPGESTELVASFPDVLDFEAVRFDVTHQSLATRQEEPSEEDN